MEVSKQPVEEFLLVWFLSDKQDKNIPEQDDEPGQVTGGWFCFPDERSSCFELSIGLIGQTQKLHSKGLSMW